MDKPSDLSRVAALLADQTQERFLVIAYDVDGATLREAGSTEAPTAEVALALGQAAAETHPTVVVLRLTEDARGVVRSAVLKSFGCGQMTASPDEPVSGPDELRRARQLGRDAGSDRGKQAADCPYPRRAIELRREWFYGFGDGRAAFRTSAGPPTA